MNPYDSTTSENSRKQLKSLENWIKILLWLALSLLVLAVLSGCGTPVVVRESCPPYPQMPQALKDYKPANLDLVPPELLPSKSAKPASTAR